MKKRQVLINAGMSLLQIVVMSVVLFILYRFLLRTIGVAELGIWSLVFAATSVTQIANLGLSASVVKFVAKYIARERTDTVTEILQTATLSVGIFVGALLIADYPMVRWLLSLIVPGQSLHAALDIVPFAFIAFWF